MRRIIPLIVALSALAALAAPSALAAERMWVGFHDDPILRWDEGRAEALNRASSANAGIVRTLVTWAHVAPERPANARDPFDPAYRLDDVDEIVRGAQARGQEVLITLWGTPKWANGGKTPNYAPRRAADLQHFATALASRYSGRFAGFPFVRYYGIWNESNFSQFLAPQYNAKGAIVGPRIYAKIAAAAYKGIKAGNRNALVAIGETASHGRDRKSGRQSDTVSPGKFAELLAKANRRLKFDAYAHHPYPYPVAMRPNQKVKWPNVNLQSLPRFEKALDGWFGRKNIPIWITEYGHETAPGEPKGISESKQAAYVTQALAMARKDPRVQMFVWFVLEDSQGSVWQSGLYRSAGSPKPALRRFAAAARKLDARNPILTVRGGTNGPKVTLPVREFCANNPPGSPVGMTVTSSTGIVLQPLSSLSAACTVTFRPIGVRVKKKQRVTLSVALNTQIGGAATRTVTVIGR